MTKLNDALKRAGELCLMQSHPETVEARRRNRTNVDLYKEAMHEVLNLLQSATKNLANSDSAKRKNSLIDKNTLSCAINWGIPHIIGCVLKLMNSTTPKVSVTSDVLNCAILTRVVPYINKMLELGAKPNKRTLDCIHHLNLSTSPDPDFIQFLTAKIGEKYVAVINETSNEQGNKSFWTHQDMVIDYGPVVFETISVESMTDWDAEEVNRLISEIGDPNDNILVIRRAALAVDSSDDLDLQRILNPSTSNSPKSTHESLSATKSTLFNSNRGPTGDCILTTIPSLRAEKDGIKKVVAPNPLFSG